MKTLRCELEGEILHALSTSGISDVVRGHLSTCELCRNTVEVDGWMKAFAAERIDQAPLPDSSMIWLKAQLMQQDGAFAQLRKSMQTLHTIAFAVVALAWAVVLSWKWTAVRGVMAQLHGGGSVLALLQPQVVSTQLLLMICTLMCATVAVAFHSAMAE